MSDLMLDVGTANEMKLALRAARGNNSSEWTPADIKSLTNADFLGKILDVIKGRAEIVIKSILAFVMEVVIPPVAGKKTRDCFRDKKRYYHRDSDLDSWLPEDQSEQLAGNFSIQQLAQLGTFKQVVESFLGITGEIPVLAQALKVKGHVTTLPTVESLVERQEAGEDVGLRTDGYANFFFVEDGDGSVSVVNVYWDDGQWLVLVLRLGNGSEWFAGYRFFFCNKTL